MRLAVYTDYTYHRRNGNVYAERAFAIFLARLRPRFEELLLIGRLSPPGGSARYAIGKDVELVALPYYPRLSQPLRAAPAMCRSLGTFWRTLGRVDCVWLLGPHPLAIAFALLAATRGKRVVLGVRQDMPAYVASRHPRRRDLQVAAVMLEAAFRVLGRVFRVVVVGPDLARKYRRSRALLEIAVSLVGEADVITREQALARSYDEELRILSVGRLETEKNPLLLANVLKRLNDAGQRCRLIVCGEGGMEEVLAERLAALGQAGRAELRGYVPFGQELSALYRESHVLLHSSWTEGLPQVLLEAFAAGLPVVASDVGGIRAAAGDAVMLVPAGDEVGAARGITEIALDPRLRARLVSAGIDFVRARTSEAETLRVARFLAQGS